MKHQHDTMMPTPITIKADFATLPPAIHKQLAHAHAETKSAPDAGTTTYVLELGGEGSFTDDTTSSCKTLNDALVAATHALSTQACDIARIVEFEPAAPAPECSDSLVLARTRDKEFGSAQFDILTKITTPPQHVALVIASTHSSTGELFKSLSPGTRLIDDTGFAAIHTALTALKTHTLPAGRAYDPTCKTLNSSPLTGPTHWFRFGADAQRTAAVFLCPQTILVLTGPAPAQKPPPALAHIPPPASPATPATLLPVEGQSPSQIISTLRSIEHDLTNGEPLCELAITARAKAATQSTNATCHLAIVARNEPHLRKHISRAIERLTHRPNTPIAHPDGLFYSGHHKAKPHRKAKTVLLFPGQGCQYTGMFREHILYCPTIRTWFERLDAHMGEDGISKCRFLHFDDNAHLLPNRDADILMSLEGGGVCTIAAELGTYELFTRLGIKADILCGYSNGENAALFASGMARFEAPDDLFATITQISRDGLRGARDGDIPTGSLLSITTNNAQEARQIVASASGPLAISTDNSPANFTVFAQPPVITKLRELLTQSGAMCVEFENQRSYHTEFFAIELPSVRQVLNSLELTAPTIPVMSCATADYFPHSTKAITELATRQYVETVRFRQTVERLYSDGATTFVDIGPRGQLAGFVRQTLGSKPHIAISVDHPNRPGLNQILQAIARLYIEGGQLNWRAFDDEFTPRD